MTEPVFGFDGEAAAMEQACAAARQSFKLFWRELSWERRRIVPALDAALIKLPFTDGPRSDGKPENEYMWVDEVDFDGNLLSGSLLNSPNWLTSVKEGDAVSAPFAHLTDWMMAAEGKAYGAYTVNLMRSRMSARERKAHDRAWGLDFGDPNQIRVELPEHDSKVTADHPMCVNMLPEFEKQLRKDASIVTATDDRGWTLLHSEALAGNFGIVKLLVRYGADANTPTPDGGDAATLARSIGWDDLAAYLSAPGCKK